MVWESTTFGISFPEKIVDFKRKRTGERHNRPGPSGRQWREGSRSREDRKWIRSGDYDRGSFSRDLYYHREIRSASPDHRRKYGKLSNCVDLLFI